MLRLIQLAGRTPTMILKAPDGSSIDEKKPRVPAGASIRLRSSIKPRGPERGRAGGGREKRGIVRSFHIHAEISELAAPVERELHLDAAADGPAQRCWSKKRPRRQEPSGRDRR